VEKSVVHRMRWRRGLMANPPFLGVMPRGGVRDAKQASGAGLAAGLPLCGVYLR